MGLRDLVAGVVRTADRVVSDLKITVQHRRWKEKNDEGEDTFFDPVPVKCTADWSRKLVRTQASETTMSRVSLTFTQPMEVNELDQFVLPDGTTGPILDMSGFLDRVTSKPFVTEVWLG